MVKDLVYHFYVKYRGHKLCLQIEMKRSIEFNFKRNLSSKISNRLNSPSWGILNFIPHYGTVIDDIDSNNIHKKDLASSVSLTHELSLHPPVVIKPTNQRIICRITMHKLSSHHF